MTTLVSLIGVIFCASFIGGFSGFGTSTLALPILFLFFPTHQALFLMAILHLSLDIWKLVLYRSGIAWNLILSFGLPAFIGSYMGSLLVVHIEQSVLARIMGLFLIGYVIFLWYRPQFHLPQTRSMAIFGGWLSGLSGGLIGMQGALRAAFLRGYEVSNVTYLAVGAAVGLLVDCIRTVSYWNHGIQLPMKIAHIFLLLVPATFAGVYAARIFVTRIDEELFSKWVAGALFIVGLKLFFIP